MMMPKAFFLPYSITTSSSIWKGIILQQNKKYFSPVVELLIIQKTRDASDIRVFFSSSSSSQQQQQRHHSTFKKHSFSSTTNSTTTKTTTANDHSNNVNKDNDDNRQIIVRHHTNDDIPGAVVSVLTLNRPKANAMGKVMLSQLKDAIRQLEEQQQQDNNNGDDGGSADDDETNSTASASKQKQQSQQQQSSSVIVAPSSSSLSSSCHTITTKTRCVVLTSYSRTVFSAGADLKERAAMSLDEAEAYVSDLRNTMQRIAQLPVPVIACIDGIAVGGGFEIALAADLRIASTKAIFGFPETSLGIIPGAGGTQRLSRVIGNVARAKELIWTASRINAQTAERYGIVNHVVDVDDKDNKECSSDNNNSSAFTFAMDMAWKIAKNGPIAIRSSKYAIDTGITAPGGMIEALQIEREAYSRILPTQDRLEGLRAFREGRVPVYKGE